MKRRSLLHATTLVLLVGSFATESAEAQVRRSPTRTPTRATPTRAPAPQVTGVSARVLRLSKGGDAKVITVTGRHLERLTGGRIERPNGRVLPADVRLPGRRVPRGGLTRRDVRIRATPRTGTGNRLKLVLTTAPDRLGRATEVPVPVRLVVLDAVRIDRARATADVRAGGEAVRYEIAGRGLGQLHHPRLERNGRTVPGTSVSFARRNDRRTVLTIDAGPNAPLGPARLVAGTVDRPMAIGDVEILRRDLARPGRRTPEALPDLVPTRIEVEAVAPDGSRRGAEEIYPSSRLFVRVEWANRGVGTASPGESHATWLVGISPGPRDRAGGRSSCPERPGETCSGGIFLADPGELSPGAYTLRLVIDPSDEVREADETNNAMELPIVVKRELPRGPANLVIESVEIDDDGAHVTIRNIGEADAFVPDTPDFLSASKYFRTHRVHGPYWIRAGETERITLRGSLPDGRCPGDGGPRTPSITFTLDRWGVVEETGGDNTFRYDLKPRAPLPGDLPDLVVESIRFRPSNPSTSDRVMIDVGMRNRGPGGAYFCPQSRVWMTRDFPTGSESGGASRGKTIKPGETFSGGVYVVEPGELAPGTYRFAVAVDPDEDVEETDDGNNSRETTLVIGE